jgi:very-short-patch-repair endonuclease
MASRFKRTPAKTERARELRREPTKWEQKLWSVLRGGRIGASFRRQHPIGPYYPDFYCASAKLVVELDGEQHGTDEALGYDAARTRFLRAKGLRVLRFANTEPKDNFDGVCEGIERALKEISTRRAPARLARQSNLRAKHAGRADLPLSGGGKHPSHS